MGSKGEIANSSAFAARLLKSIAGLWAGSKAAASRGVGSLEAARFYPRSIACGAITMSVVARPLDIALLASRVDVDQGEARSLAHVGRFDRDYVLIFLGSDFQFRDRP